MDEQTARLAKRAKDWPSAGSLWGDLGFGTHSQRNGLPTDWSMDAYIIDAGSMRVFPLGGFRGEDVALIRVHREGRGGWYETDGTVFILDGEQLPPLDTEKAFDLLYALRQK